LHGEQKLQRKRNTCPKFHIKCFEKEKKDVNISQGLFVAQFRAMHNHPQARTAVTIKRIPSKLNETLRDY
jgi:hypothetical protein